MDAVLHIASLANLLLIPAVIGIYRIGRALQSLDAFMAESKADRLALRAKVEPMERALLARGILSPD